MIKHILSGNCPTHHFINPKNKAQQHFFRSKYISAITKGIIIFLMFMPVSITAGDDVPVPVQNLETIPTGSWVIAMDNTNQGISGVMNVKSYGLAMEMLWANIPLKWIIKAGKAKDAVDMSLQATQIIPTTVADSTLPTQNFESTAPSPAWTYTSTSGGTNTTANKYNGGRSWRMASTPTLTMTNVNISNYTNVSVRVAFASFNVDAGEDLIMDLSYNGGTTWTTVGTGSVTLVAPNVTNASLDINTTTGYTVSSNPYTMNISSSATQVSVRFRTSSTLETSEYYYIDDVQLSGTFKHNFISGPMVILPSDTAAARTVVNSFNGSLAAAERVKVYRTDEAISADVRYTLTHKPYIAFFDDGGNANIHEDYLISAGLSASRYQTIAPGTIIDTLSCFTFASEPHWDHVGDPYTKNDSLRINNLKFFLETGGNFLAQCIAVEAFEEFPAYRFQSTNGFLELGVEGADPNLVYSNADIATMQMHGSFNNDGGSLDSWTLNTGSSWKSPAYKGIYYLSNVIGDAALDTVVHVSSTKIVSSDKIGGNLTYLSGHNYSGTTIDQINGRRIYLNSLFVPALRMLPQGSAYANASTLCERDTLKLFVNPPVKNSAGLTYAWTGPNGYTSSSQNPIIPNFSDSHVGEYTVTLTMPGGCKLTYSAIPVVMAPKIGNVNASGSLSGCVNSNGYQAVLTAPTPSAGTGIWTKVSGPGTIVNGTSNIASITGLSTTGTATVVKWNVTTSQSCRDSSIVTLNPPVVDSTYLSKYDTSYCLICPVENGGTYYYIDPAGKILSAITDIADGTSIGETEFCARLTYTLPGNPSVNDVPTVATAQGGQPYMPRYWSVHTEMTGAMRVRLFFTDEELASLVGKSAGTRFEFYDVSGLYATIYPESNPGSRFMPAGSSNSTTIVPQFIRRGNYWEATFQTSGSATYYLHPAAFGGAPLPIELLSFDAKTDNSTVHTSWSTASEKNNDFFTVERSKDAIHFEAIGEVDGAGNSNTVLYYSFTDTKPHLGASYYRLKQTDFDGSYSYSKIVHVIIVKSNFSIYPNPSNGIFTIELMDMVNQEVSIRVYDNTGRMVYNKKQFVEKDNQTLNVDLTGLPKGMYTVICSVGNMSRKKTISIQ